MKKFISRIVDKKLAKSGWKITFEDDYLVQYARPLTEMKSENNGIVEVVDLLASGILTSRVYIDVGNYYIRVTIKTNELFLFAVKLWCIGRKNK